MEKSYDIVEQRENLKQELAGLSEETLPAKILQASGSVIQKLTRQSTPVPWYVSTICLLIATLLPQTVLAILLQDPNQLIGTGTFWSMAVLLVAPILPLFYLITRYTFAILSEHIVDEIQELPDLDDLRNFLLEIRNQRTHRLRALIGATLWFSIAVPIFSFLNHGFIGLSYAMDVWWWGFFAMGVGFPFIVWLMQFPKHFMKYRLNLYELNPAKSEVIEHLSDIFTRPFLVSAVFLATGTFIASLFNIFIWTVLVIVFIFWIPLIMQFINSQTAINKIINSEKWRTLNQLKEQIHTQKNEVGLRSPEQIEATKNLMDLYEKVYDSRNNRLTLNNIFDFLNQLLLPLLAFVISNYDDVLKFFHLKP